MKKIKSFLKKSFDKQIDGTGLAVFRITYSLVLLCEIAQMYYFRHLIFDKVPYLKEAEINFGIPIGIWFIAVLFILFGAFTRFFTILNYLMGLILIGSIHSFEYHMFYAYMGINFLLMFIPVSQCLSLDRLLLKLKYSNTTFQYNPPKKISQLYYFIPPFVGIGLVYMDSVFFKLASSMWVSGLGIWLPSSLPMISHVNNSWILNHEWIIKFFGWLTILFEASFLFIFFRKKWRIPVFITGMILHLGILVQFPIPLFAIGVCTIYLLLLPVSFWQKIFLSKANNNPTLTFYYDTECPLCIRTKLAITHLDWFNRIQFKTVQFDAQDSVELKNKDIQTLYQDIHSVDSKGKVYAGVDTYIQVLKRIFYLYPIALLIKLPGIYYLAKKIYNYIAANRTTERCTEENCGYNPPSIPDNSKIKILQGMTLSDLKYKLLAFILCLITFIQFTFLYKTWLVAKVRNNIGLTGTKADRILDKVVNSYAKTVKIAIGVTNHPVFSNEIHFDNYNHIIAVVYIDKNSNEHWLPIIDKNGMPGYYIYGSNWVNWTFRVNGKDVTPAVLNNGIEKYTSFWAYRNGIDLSNATFLIKVKKIDSPKGWEKDFLNNQIAKPWIDGGYVEWKNNEFISSVKNIESL